MSNEEKKRRCKSCGKLLLDEKGLLCKRCLLEGRNKIMKIGSTVCGFAATAYGIVAYKENGLSGSDNISNNTMI